MRRPLLVANWKMNGSRAMARDLASRIAVGSKAFAAVDIVICPSHVLINDVVEAVAGSAVAVGSQDASEYASGAYTGETSCAMLRDYSCTFAIVGHSERRQFFGDTNERVARKFNMACQHDLVPIICVGETLEQRRQDRTETVIASQLEPVFALEDANALMRKAVIAYEPVWAIGTGETATPEQVAQVHAFIRTQLGGRETALAHCVRVLYGGSVKPDNAEALFAIPDVDGGLVGGASLNADDFLEICATAS